MRGIAVFASGGGSNLQSLIEHFNVKNNEVARVTLVISDRAEAGALRRATAAGIAARTITTQGRDPADLATETLAALADAGADIIALAGYLKLVPDAVVRAYRGRILNIHPALLPAFGGKGMYGARVHRAVIEAGCCVTGVTVHHVDERYDEGRPLLQWPVPVLAGDSPETLGARVLRIEHAVYGPAIEALARRSPIAGSGLAAPDAAVFECNDEGRPPDAVRLQRLLEIGGTES
jgi:formyltetrahydrofolate-dependent phosphoribosylglycinamide formyltransferase